MDSHQRIDHLRAATLANQLQSPSAINGMVVRWSPHTAPTKGVKTSRYANRTHLKDGLVSEAHITLLHQQTVDEPREYRNRVPYNNGRALYGP